MATRIWRRNTSPALLLLLLLAVTAAAAEARRAAVGMRQLKSASSSSQHDDPATSDDEGPVLFPSLTGTLPPSHLSGGSSGRASPLPVAGLAGGDEEVSFPAKPRGEALTLMEKEWQEKELLLPRRSDDDDYTSTNTGMKEGWWS
uniref:Uncharacterized protein n=1 Tax=Oryza glaberrima TaxID=4538 RepID=I1PRY2_ORYGL